MGWLPGLIGCPEDRRIGTVREFGILQMSLVGACAAIVFVRKVTDPLASLAHAAQTVEQGCYDLSGLAAVSERGDELGRLARSFEQMAGKVGQREKTLQRQVDELKIMIDREKQAQDVSEIVETDYFRSLKEKARKFRQI